MRALLRLTIAFLPLVHGQDSAVLKSVEPDYTKYSPDLATAFETAVTPVTVTVQSDGKPRSFSSIPLPMAVVMALKDYEFRPLGTVPHGRAGIDGATYEVTLDVPIRQSKDPGLPSDPIALQNPARAEVIVAGPNGKPAVKEVQAIRIGRGIAAGMVMHRVQPTYPEAAKEARIQGTVTLEVMISKQGNVTSLKTSGGPFALIEPAFEAVRQWTFRPFLEAREPVEVIADVPVVFSLK